MTPLTDLLPIAQCCRPKVRFRRVRMVIYTQRRQANREAGSFVLDAVYNNAAVMQFGNNLDQV